MTASPLTRHLVAALPARQLHAICALYDRVWPEEGTAPGERQERWIQEWRRSEREVFALWEGDQPQALAMVFSRVVTSAEGPLRVQALACVCSAPERRGRGWGRAVVRAAFTEVDAGRFPVALFQTGVPEFYTKLGARTVPNTFVNPRHGPDDRGSSRQPWWEPHVMIYPAGYRWPAGTIDLGGAGY